MIHAPAPLPHGPGGIVAKPYERLLKSGLVEIEALAFIRGRSIARRFFILDEAQQLTPHNDGGLDIAATDGFAADPYWRERIATEGDRFLTR